MTRRRNPPLWLRWAQGFATPGLLALAMVAITLGVKFLWMLTLGGR